MTAILTAGAPASASTTLADARFIDLVTFRRTGQPVGTPVLFVADGDRLLVRTAHDAGKLKRLRHTSAVEVAPCDQRGRRLGPAIPGALVSSAPMRSGPHSPACTPSIASPVRCSPRCATCAARAT